MKKTREASKILLLCVLLYCGAALTAILIGWLCGNTTDAATLAGVFSAPAVTVISFYTIKARSENLIKLQQLGISCPPTDSGGQIDSAEQIESDEPTSTEQGDAQ